MSTESIIDLITADHQKVRKLYGEYKQTGDVKEKQVLVNTIIREMSLHADAEEEILYPAMQKKFSNGTELVDHLRQAHVDVKTELYGIDGISVSEPGFEAKLDKAIEDFNQHAQHEEIHELPTLASVSSQEELEAFGKAFKLKKYFVPTHPHPSAPQTPPLHTVAGLLTKPIDLVRDLGRDFKDDQ